MLNLCTGVLHVGENYHSFGEMLFLQTVFFILYCILQVYRHGDRSPVHFFSKDTHKNYWPQGLGQLTQVCLMFKKSLLVEVIESVFSLWEEGGRGEG